MPDVVSKSQRTEAFSEGLQGRTLFSAEANYDFFGAKLHEGFLIKRTPITAAFDFESFQKQYGGEALPMFIITETKKLQMVTIEEPSEARNGQILISLVPGNSASCRQ